LGPAGGEIGTTGWEQGGYQPIRIPAVAVRGELLLRGHSGGNGEMAARWDERAGAAPRDRRRVESMLARTSFSSVFCWWGGTRTGRAE